MKSFLAAIVLALAPVLAAAPCTLVHPATPTNAPYYEGDCAKTTECQYIVGNFGGGWYGSCKDKSAPAEAPTVIPMSTCPVPLPPDALNPAGSWWLFYHYAKTAMSPYTIWRTPSGNQNAAAAPYNPTTWLPWSCRKPGNWGPAFRGWPLPAGFHCGDQAGHTQRCDTQASWVLDPTKPGGHRYVGP